jgi:hypothetical protein
MTNGLASQESEKPYREKYLLRFFMRMPQTGGRAIGKGDMPIEIEAES